MNIYTAKFHAQCPSNGGWIEYTLTINTGAVLRVEKILDCVHHLKTGYHEDFAEHLHNMFGGSQTLEAHHHGVDIKTIRPHLAHWSQA